MNYAETTDKSAIIFYFVHFFLCFFFFVATSIAVCFFFFNLLKMNLIIEKNEIPISGYIIRSFSLFLFFWVYFFLFFFCFKFYPMTVNENLIFSNLPER